MLAMQLLAPWPVDHDDPLVVSELPEPEPGPGQILLTVRACGRLLYTSDAADE